MNYRESAEFLIAKNIVQPAIGIILGTGLHKPLEYITIEQTISYTDIPDFPLSTVEFHKGNLIYGSINNKKVVVMQGRLNIAEIKEAPGKADEKLSKLLYEIILEL